MTGILGGTFDPPHNGHLALAEAALRELGLDELVVLLAGQPGHRDCAADAETRLLLARAAFEGLSRTRVERDDNPYTVDAVRGGRFGDAIFLVGADEGAAFPSWRDPAGVLEAVRLAIGARSGYDWPEFGEQFGDRVFTFSLDSPSISSSDVRARVARGERIDELAPPAVVRLIDELGLYRSSGNGGYTETDHERI